MKIVSSFVEYQREGSNWAADKIIEMNIHVINYNPLKGSSYIPSKQEAGDQHTKKPQKDQKCFMWSVLASLYPSKKDPQRVIHYVQHVEKLDFSGIAFPVRICGVPKFEKETVFKSTYLDMRKVASYHRKGSKTCLSPSDSERKRTTLLLHQKLQQTHGGSKCR